MNMLTNSGRKTLNERSTLFKYRAKKICRWVFSFSAIMRLCLLILSFLFMGFLIRYLAVTNEVPVHAGQEYSSPPQKGQNSPEKVSYTVKPGDTFYEILEGLNVTHQEIFRILQCSTAVCDLKKVRPGSSVTLAIDHPGKTVRRLEYPFDDQHLLVIQKTSCGFTASKENIPRETSLRTISGTIKNNLFDDAIEAGGNPRLVLNFADIFAWDIDFFTDLRTNDRFKILFEEVYQEGKLTKQGRILAACFITSTKQLRVFLFDNGRGRSGYYDDRGKSVDREFLKSPLRYSRISSGFSKRRFHPILKTYRPHLGVDYAAPTGTPVEATGDGKITYIGWRGDYGKCVIIRHNRIYTSFYGHLSRYAKGMKRGKRVTQGQVIGYVGKTGLATGPHLDYRLKVRGSFINPLTFRSGQKHAISKELKPQFERRRRQLLLKLEQLDEAPLLARK